MFPKLNGRLLKDYQLLNVFVLGKDIGEFRGGRGKGIRRGKSGQSLKVRYSKETRGE